MQSYHNLPNIRQIIQNSNSLPPESTETRCLKLSNKDLYVTKGKACLYLDLLSSSSTNKQGI